ncbi:MAG: hypothetical protein A4E32_01338 [Methanomassiliicoccales archaeon PtaU1.Bin124]|nr:MAG: hypothetical protein A4E32_01338 [Methanomassiliicoccales archaeon PtaU1.Bin124]
MNVPATSGDMEQYLERYVCDGQMHLVMEFASPLDEERLRRAARLVLEVEPVLACRWEGGRRPYWKHREGIYSLSSFMLVPCEDPMAEVMGFMATRSDPSIDPLVQVRLFRGRTDMVCIKLSHSVSDVHGLKHVAYLLCGLYNGEMPENLPSEDRTAMPIFDLARTETEKGTPWPLDAKRRGTIWSLPFTSRDAQGAMSLMRTFDAETCHTILMFAAGKGHSLEDVFLAAFMVSALQVMNPKEGVVVPFQATYDLRHLAEGKGADVANLTGRTSIEIAMHGGMRLEDALVAIKVCQGPDGRPRGPIPVFHIGPFTSFDTVRTKYEEEVDLALKARVSPPLWVRAGSIDKARLGFQGLAPSSAFIFAPTTYPPMLQACLSEFDGSTTVGIGFSSYGTDENDIRAIMEGMAAVLPR